MNIPQKLLAARRALEEISEYELIQDWKLEKVSKSWYIIFKIKIYSNINFDKETYWVALTDENYPNSEIEIYPERQKGISNTYPHQSNNALKINSSLIKSGKICLKKIDINFADENTFLLEHIYSLIDWIKAADKGNLLKEGDYFENLDYNISKNSIVAFNETEETYFKWQELDTFYGYTELKCTDNFKIITKFKDIKNKKVIFNNLWGGFSNKITKKELGVWIRLDKFLVLNEWQAPNTFEELNNCFINQNKNFFEILAKLTKALRDNKEHVVSIGFPVSEVMGSNKKTIFWQSFLLPKLTNKEIKGFRKTEENYFNNDLKNILKKGILIKWITSENWNKNNLLKRGSYPKEICNLNFLIIGAGSLASSLCEMLVRNGIVFLGIIDYDSFETGNIARHTLDIRDISKVKSFALKERLEYLNPHVKIKSFNKKFDKFFEKDLKEYDVIIDCTADEKVLTTLSELKGKQKLFSASFGYNAEKLYLYSGVLDSFSKELFLKKISSYVKKDLEYIKYSPLPWKGIGCWSSVFPAKFSDVLLVSATIVSIIIKFLTKEESSSKYFIYQKMYDREGYLLGFKNANDKI